MINTKQKVGLGAKGTKGVKETTENQSRLKKSWQEELADQLYEPIKRNFPKRRVIAHDVDDIWCSDLVEMQKLSKWNKGYKYFLMFSDIFSKYGFQIIFKENKPKMLWVDKGKEHNKNVLDLLAKNDVKICATENEEKSSVCERWNRTIKTKMYKQFTIRNNTVYIDILPKILSSYNNSKHRSIGMTPRQARQPKNYGKAYFNLYGDLETHARARNLKVGDRVRISKYKRKTFDKGYTPNWTEEFFIVDEIQWTNPITYKIRDLNGELIKGTFYREELQKTDQEVYRIEKVIHKTKDKALVKWKGYPDEFYSWVSLKDLTDL